MASTLKLQDVVDWARTFKALIPVVGVAGFTQEPALSICNDVLQEILMGGIDARTNRPFGPFPWKWNRKSLTSFVTTDKQQDYTASASDVAWLESCVLEEEANTGTPKPLREIEIAMRLPRESEIDNPTKVALQGETDSTVTLRFWKTPGTVIWRAYIDYQAKPPRKTALSSTWSPIPDELALVIRQGFLAHAYRHAGDGKFLVEHTRFQQLLQRAFSGADAEPQHEAFFPERPIMLG